MLKTACFTILSVPIFGKPCVLRCFPAPGRQIACFSRVLLRPRAENHAFYDVSWRLHAENHAFYDVFRALGVENNAFYDVSLALRTENRAFCHHLLGSGICQGVCTGPRSIDLWHCLADAGIGIFFIYYISVNRGPEKNKQKVTRNLAVDALQCKKNSFLKLQY